MPSSTVSGRTCGRERLEHRGVEVPAGRRDGVAGGDDARAVDPAEVDRLLQRDVEQEAAGLDEQAEVAHGREPGPQRPAGVGDRPQRAHRGVVLHRHRAGCAWSGPPSSRLTSMSISPGSSVRSPRSTIDRVVGHRRRRDLHDALAVDQQVARARPARPCRRRACGRCAGGRAAAGCGDGPCRKAIPPAHAVPVEREPIIVSAMEQLEGRTAVVTGAASGIGLAVAEAFVAEGMQRRDGGRRRGRPRRAGDAARPARWRRCTPSSSTSVTPTPSTAPVGPPSSASGRSTSR